MDLANICISEEYLSFATRKLNGSVIWVFNIWSFHRFWTTRQSCTRFLTQILADTTSPHDSCISQPLYLREMDAACLLLERLEPHISPVTLSNIPILLTWGRDYVEWSLILPLYGIPKLEVHIWPSIHSIGSGRILHRCRFTQTDGIGKSYLGTKRVFQRKKKKPEVDFFFWATRTYLVMRHIFWGVWRLVKNVRVQSIGQMRTSNLKLWKHVCLVRSRGKDSQGLHCQDDKIQSPSFEFEDNTPSCPRPTDYY